MSSAPSSAPSSTVPSARSSLIIPSQSPRSSTSSAVMSFNATSSLSFTLLDEAVNRLTQTSNTFKLQKKKKLETQSDKLNEGNTNTEESNTANQHDNDNQAETQGTGTNEAAAIISEVDACLALLRLAKVSY